MPYFFPQPTDDEIAAWLFPNAAPHKVPGWPRPQSNRVDARFRLEFTDPVDGWTASRYLFFHFRSNPPEGGGGGPEIGLWGWFDMDTGPFSDLGTILPPDPTNLTLEITITSGDPLTHEPGPGVEVFAASSIPGIGGAEMVYDWGLNGPRPWRFNVQMNTYPATSFDESFSAPWPWFINAFRMFAVNDCYTFPRIP